MNSIVTFLDCPAYMNKTGSVRCGLPAEVEGRYLMSSTDGALESARIRCPRGHWFNGPIESLTFTEHPPRRSPASASPADASPGGPSSLRPPPASSR